MRDIRPIDIVGSNGAINRSGYRCRKAGIRRAAQYVLFWWPSWLSTRDVAVEGSVANCWCRPLEGFAEATTLLICEEPLTWQLGLVL